MSECNIDHSVEDVRKKYESQITFLPQDMKTLFEEFFQKEHTQDILNDVFHLLKNMTYRQRTRKTKEIGDCC